MTDEQVREIEQRLGSVENQMNRPLLTTKQLVAVLVTACSFIFAAGSWANSVQSSIAGIESTLLETRTDLRQLGEVAILRARIDSLNTEVERLRNRLEAQ